MILGSGFITAKAVYERIAIHRVFFDKKKSLEFDCVINDKLDSLAKHLDGHIFHVVQLDKLKLLYDDELFHFSLYQNVEYVYVAIFSEFEVSKYRGLVSDNSARMITNEDVLALNTLENLLGDQRYLDCDFLKKRIDKLKEANYPISILVKQLLSSNCLTPNQVSYLKSVQEQGF